jgi:hypothetical protein
MTPDEAIAKLRTLPEDKQRAVLMQLSPDERKDILGKLTPAPEKPKGFWATYDEKVAPLVTPTPHKLPTSEERKDIKSFGKYAGREYLKGGANIGAGVLSVLLHPLDTAGGVVKTAVRQLPPVALAEHLYRGTDANQEMAEQFVKAPLETTETMIGQGIVLDAAGRAIPEVKAAPGKVGEILKEKYGPRQVEVGGEKVPVTVGEAEPSTAVGRKQTALKRSGVGARKFEKFEKAQSDKVKSVIRNTAQKTSGLVGPMQEEPGSALKSAADATFERARPMYAALDEELVTVPGDLHSASAIVKKAISRAKGLGYDFEASQEAHYGEEPLGTGKPVSDASHPLTDFQKIRSELGKMRRGSKDPALRYRISEEMKQMTDAMDKALDNTGLKETWKEADRLWAKGYALNSIADALKESTEGVEAAVQPKGVEAIPSEIKGRALEETLKDLADDGTLARGLSPDEISNLRQSANILKRAQGTSTGTGYGESGSRSRAIAHILRGAPGPIVGAGVGAGIGALTGHPWYGMEMGGFAGFIVQSIGERGLVNVMTKLDGVKALDALEKAKTPAQVQTAMTALTAAAAPKKRVAAALSGP